MLVLDETGKPHPRAPGAHTLAAARRCDNTQAPCACASRARAHIHTMQPWRQQHTSATAPAGLACLAAVGLVLAIVQQAVAEPDVDSHWVQIAHCHHLDGRSGPPQRLDKSLDEIFQLANQATRVRICTDKGRCAVHL